MFDSEESEGVKKKITKINKNILLYLLSKIIALAIDEIYIIIDRIVKG